MISCVYALLLTAADRIYDYEYRESELLTKQVPNLERLVLLADDPKGSSYGTYNLPYTGEFPTLQDNFDIFMTATQKTSSQTKLRAYCSPTLSSSQILKKIRDELQPNIEFRYPKPENSVLSSEICLEAIKTEWYGDKNRYSSPRVPIYPNKICSNSDIIGLAFQGDISVTGIYHGFAPPNRRLAPTIKFQNPLNLQDLVLERQIYAAWENDKSQMVLVWYFGQLHIFKREDEQQVWWPETKIGGDKVNAAKILNFMRKKLGLFQTLEKKLKSHPVPRKLAELTRMSSTGKSSGDINKASQLMAEITSIELGQPVRVPISYLRNLIGMYEENRSVRRASF